MTEGTGSTMRARHRVGAAAVAGSGNHHRVHALVLQGIHPSSGCEEQQLPSRRAQVLVLHTCCRPALSMVHAKECGAQPCLCIRHLLAPCQTNADDVAWSGQNRTDRPQHRQPGMEACLKEEPNLNLEGSYSRRKAITLATACGGGAHRNEERNVFRRRNPPAAPMQQVRHPLRGSGDTAAEAPDQGRPPQYRLSQHQQAPLRCEACHVGGARCRKGRSFGGASPARYFRQLLACRLRGGPNLHHRCPPDLLVRLHKVTPHMHMEACGCCLSRGPATLPAAGRSADREGRQDVLPS